MLQFVQPEREGYPVYVVRLSVASCESAGGLHTCCVPSGGCRLGEHRIASPWRGI